MDSWSPPGSVLEVEPKESPEAHESPPGFKASHKFKLLSTRGLESIFTSKRQDHIDSVFIACGGCWYTLQLKMLSMNTSKVYPQLGRCRYVEGISWMAQNA